MGVKAIAAEPNCASLVDQDTGDTTPARWAVRHGVSLQDQGGSIALSRAGRLRPSKAVQCSRGESRLNAGASATAAVCALWLCIGAAADNALGGERDNRAAQAFVAIENGRETAQANAKRNESSLEATVGKAAQTSQSAPARERRLSLEHEQEWNRAEALARALTSSLQGQLDAVRSAAEAEKIKQKQLLDQERGRADAFARELASLQAEFDKARTVGLEAVQATEAESNQKQALDQERDKAERLARELASVRAELDAARIAAPEAVQATEEQSKQKLALEQAAKQEHDKADALARELASVRADLDTARAAARDTAQTREAQGKKKQALEQAVKQERDKADALARELASVRADLDTARAAARNTAQADEAAKLEQEQAIGKERNKTERLARELAAARKEIDARSTLLAAAHAEISHLTETSKAGATEQKLAVASERDRADALARELTSARDELQAVKRQIVAASTSGQSSVSESPPPEAQPAVRAAAPDSAPKAAAAIARSTSVGAPRSSLVDEQRLLARATALLEQADISSARPLLQHALEHGSAQAAFMLAETYDARVLQSWRASGISGDRTKARELYERAQAGGIEGAKERIETLK